MAWAARLGVPLVDADGMGRAFPEVQMVTQYVAGLPVNLSLVAVSSETREQLSQQRAAKGGDPYPFPLVSDSSLKIFKAYRCYDDFEKTPLHGTFLIDVDKAGQPRIRWQDISYDPFSDASFLLGECKRLLSLK